MVVKMVVEHGADTELADAVRTRPKEANSSRPGQLPEEQQSDGPTHLVCSTGARPSTSSSRATPTNSRLILRSW